MTGDYTSAGRPYSVIAVDKRTVRRNMRALLVIVIVAFQAIPILAEEKPAEDNPYALCGGTREACDPFSYLSNDYAIPERGDYVAPVRPPYANYTSPWAGSPGPWGYWGSPGYWGPPGPWGPPVAWPIPVPFTGSPFRPGFPFGHPSGFSGFFGHPASGFFLGFSTVPGAPFPTGVHPVPGRNFNHGFGQRQPMTHPGVGNQPGNLGIGSSPITPAHRPVMPRR